MPKSRMVSPPRRLPQRCAVLFLLLSLGRSARAQTSRDTTAAADRQRDSLATLLQSHGYVAVPFFGDGRPRYVQAIIDTTPVTLKLDSGFGGDVSIGLSVAEAAGVRGSPTDSAAGIGGTEAQDTARLTRFTLGTTRVDSQFAVIGHISEDDLLGARWFAAHGAIMDYVRGVLYVCAVQTGCALPPHALERKGGVTIPLKRFSRSTPSGVRYRYFVDAVVRGSNPLALILDTGADPELVLDQHRVEQLGLSAKLGTSPGLGSTGHIVVMHSGQLDSLTLGAVRLDSLPFVALDMSAPQQLGRREGFPAFDGLLGAGVLIAHNALIDYGHDMMYLDK